MRVLVTGATGFVGRRLVPALLAEGHDVLAMTRHPESYRGPAEARYGHSGDPRSLTAAVHKADAAYYLLHDLTEPGFHAREAVRARGFATAAARAGVGQVVYLGGLGDGADRLSEHLRSRRLVEAALASTDVPTTALRAGIVVGAGSAGWEILRQLVTRLPVLVAPPWADTRCQPVAAPDAIGYLVGVLGRDEALGRTFEIGGEEVFTYRSMLERTAALLGRTRAVLGVPGVPAVLARIGLAALTDVDARLASSLLASMGNEVVVRDPAIKALVPRRLLPFDEAVRQAAAEPRAADLRRT